MKTKLSLVALVAGALLAAGCSDEIQAEDVARVSADRTASLVSGLTGSAQGVQNVEGLAQMTSALNALQQGFNGVTLSGDAPPCAPGTPCEAPPPEPIAQPVAPTTAEADQANAEIAKLFKERIFTEANVESADDESAIFRVGGDDLCSDGTTPPNPDCVTQIDKLELRIEARPVGDSEIDLALMLGPSRSRPLTLELRNNGGAVIVDLGQAKAAAEFVAGLGGETLDLPTMSGRVELRAVKNAEQDFTVSLSTLSLVSIAGTDDAGNSTRFETAARAPLAALRLNGPEKSFKLDLDLGETVFSSPYTSDPLNPLAGSQMTVQLGGASMSLAAKEGDTQVTAARLGLGDVQTFAKLGDQVIFSADLNPSSNRRFDLTLSKDTDGQGLITVTPEFDLVLRYFMSPLKADPMQVVASYAEDETYTVKLAGDGSATIKPLPADLSGFDGGLKVVAGSLTLSSNKQASALEVTAGQCLVDKDVIDVGAHELLGHFAVQSSCP